MKTSSVSEFSSHNFENSDSCVDSFMSCHYLFLEHTSIIVSFRVNKIIPIYIAVICYSLFIRKQLANELLSGQLQIWIWSTRISTIRPNNVPIKDVKTNFISQSSTFKFMTKPVLAVWRWFVYWEISTIQWNPNTWTVDRSRLSNESLIKLNLFERNWYIRYTLETIEFVTIK